MDRSRTTEDSSHRVVADERSIDVIVQEPADDGAGPLPLVVFGHGYGSNGRAFAGLVRPWVRAGYVVATPTYPATRGGFRPEPALNGYVEQPRDVSFLLDQLLRLDADPGSELYGRIDEDHIAVGGHSLGAVTTLGLAVNSCCRDERVDALIPVAGQLVPFPDGDWDFRSDRPSLVVHGDVDPTYALDRGVFDRMASPKYFLTLVGADHQFFGRRWDDALRAAVVPFLDAYLKQQPDAVQRLKDSAVPGVTTLDAVPAAG